MPYSFSSISRNTRNASAGSVVVPDLEMMFTDTRLPSHRDDLEKNDCYKYAALRNILYRKGKSVELLVSYEPSFAMMNEWFKQLYGESEGSPGYAREWCPASPSG